MSRRAAGSAAVHRADRAHRALARAQRVRAALRAGVRWRVGIEVKRGL